MMLHGMMWQARLIADDGQDGTIFPGHLGPGNLEDN
jgi:hypothetical protein